MATTSGSAIVALGLLDLVRAWHRDGAGSRAIAARLKRERNIDVSHMTVSRLLSPGTDPTAAPPARSRPGQPARPPRRPPADEHPVDRLERRATTRERRAAAREDRRSAAARQEVLESEPVESDPIATAALAASPALDAQKVAELIEWCHRAVRQGRERIWIPRWQARQMVNLLERLPETGRGDGEDNLAARGVSGVMTQAAVVGEHLYVRGGLRPDDGPDEELVEVVRYITMEHRFKALAGLTGLFKVKYGTRSQVLNVHVGGALPAAAAAAAEQLAQLSPAALFYLQRGELPPPGVADVPIEQLERTLAGGAAQGNRGGGKC